MTGSNWTKRTIVALMGIVLLLSFHGVLSEGVFLSFGKAEDIVVETDESRKDVDEKPVTIRETKLESYMLPGNIITFGTYPQTKEGTDQTPIEWIVLDYDEANHKTLLISRYCLDTMKYDTSFSGVTWEKCTLRSWLNDEFLNKAFSEKEQSAILTTEVDNSENQSFGELGLLWGNDTQDKIFLLSVADARFYFGARWWEEDDGENTASRAAPTAYAIKQGAGVIDGCLTADGEPAWWWWLRSSGLSRNNAARVNYDGSLHDDSDADPAYGTVRPVLWLDLNADTMQLFAQGVYAEGAPLLFSGVTGYAMPSLGEAIQRYPNTETENEDGSVTEIYSKVREKEYNIFAEYLEKQNATVEDYQINNGVLTAKIQANGASFNLAYNSITYEATVTYPNGTYDERNKSAKEHFAEAEKLFQEEKTDEAYKEIAAISQYDRYEPVKTLLQDDKKLRTVPYRLIGETVTFGKCEQDNDVENGSEPIEWIVLDCDEKENKALLISKYGLRVQQYSFRGKNTWESSFVRRWLNEDFQWSSFTEEETEAILSTEVDNSSSQGFSEWNTDGGNNTIDRVFLLSYAEACQYFGYFGTTVSGTNKDLILMLTPYAASSEHYGNSMHKTGDGKAAVVWWLRSPGHQQGFAATVFSNWLSDDVIDDATCVVRPVLWLDLNADIF